MALLVEALMMRTVRRLWNLRTGEPAPNSDVIEALAALLLDQGRAEEAERVYQDDLGLSGSVQRCAQYPDNVWALHGLAECLGRRGEAAELPGMQAKLAMALAKADMAITSSCLCRTSIDTKGSCCH